MGNSYFKTSPISPVASLKDLLLLQKKINDLKTEMILTLLRSERPKLYEIRPFLVQ